MMATSGEGGKKRGRGGLNCISNLLLLFRLQHLKQIGQNTNAC